MPDGACFGENLFVPQIVSGIVCVSGHFEFCNTSEVQVLAVICNMGVTGTKCTHRSVDIIVTYEEI